VKAYGIGQNITAHKREEESYKQAIRDVAQSAGNTLGSFSLTLRKTGAATEKAATILYSGSRTPARRTVIFSPFQTASPMRRYAKRA
jgi:hypothetical protein